MKNTPSLLSTLRSVWAFWLLVILVVLQFGRMHQLERRLDALMPPDSNSDQGEVSEDAKPVSVSENVLSFLDAFGASKEMEQREMANIDAAKTYFKSVDWKTHDLNLRNVEGVPVENGLGFILESQDLPLVTFTLDHEGLTSIQGYRSEIPVEEPELFESGKTALENYLSSSDFSEDQQALSAVQTVEQNFVSNVLNDPAVAQVLKNKGMKFDYSEEDFQEQRLVFTNVELTPVLLATVNKHDASLSLHVLASLHEPVALASGPVDVSGFLTLLESVDARSKVDQVVGGRLEELDRLFQDSATQSIMDRHHLKVGQRLEDSQFYVYPLSDDKGVSVAEILLDRASGDVKVRFNGQVWSLVEATESLSTLKKNS